MENLNIYVSVLQDSLRKKLEIIQTILKLTQEQSRILDQEEVDTDQFDEIVEQKAVKIDEMLELDKGFQTLFKKIGDSLKENRHMFQSQILEMQNYIRVITDCGVKLEALEQNNKVRFSNFLAKKRKDIKSFKVSNKTAVSYYKNMANHHQEWQSYFLNEKK